MLTDEVKSLRCAIYTRKSTEEGLEQEFNSLDAQRVACEAYIQSQQHEGWLLVDENYDDGGFTGGNMKRPALTHLLADVKAGKVDVIVVYKVDRLTRNLADFARIVDVLDNQGASFVSVTQSFNTTTSMGRLTLNVLLSFAQFEREVTSERIRDKIAASKARGMWVGGRVPFGYEVEDRKLIVCEEYAEKLRMIFDRYLALGSVVALAQELERDGICSPRRTSRAGRVSGGAILSQGALALMLRNRTYVGEVTHKGASYPGQHKAIIEPHIYTEAGLLLDSNRANTIAGLNAEHPSLLAGLVWDAHGRKMTPDHASKRGKRYRYYASKKTPEISAKPFRVPAGDLEGLSLVHLRKRLELCQREQGAEGNISAITRLEVRTHIEKIIVSIEQIEIYFTSPLLTGETILQISVQLARCGKEVRLAQPPSESVISRRDLALIKLVIKARVAREALEKSESESVAGLAKEQGYSADYFRVLLRISYLAPDIVSAIIDGRQPAHFNRQRLARSTNLPIDWQAQREILGFS